MDLQKQEHSELHIHNTAFVLPFSALDRDSLALAGGKGANLGEMANAGFPVPPGFCITTPAYEHAAAGADLVCGLLAYNLAGRLLDDLATPDELQSVLRGLPHNPTTEMDLALWDLARVAPPSGTASLALRRPRASRSISISAIPITTRDAPGNASLTRTHNGRGARYPRPHGRSPGTGRNPGCPLH